MRDDVDENIKIVSNELIQKRKSAEKSKGKNSAETQGNSKTSHQYKADKMYIIQGDGDMRFDDDNQSHGDTSTTEIQTSIIEPAPVKRTEHSSDLETAVNRSDDKGIKEALSQGRKPLRPRLLGQRVRQGHMTPREYKYFTAGIWDGIETRHGAFDWDLWDWDNNCPQDDAFKTERRTYSERRTKRSSSFFYSKREGIGRRSSDKVSLRLHRIMLTIVLGILLSQGLAVLYFNIIN